MTSPSSTAPSQSGPQASKPWPPRPGAISSACAFPAPNWVPPVDGPDGKPALDVLVIGAGMCGQTLALALARDGVRNIRVVDRAPRGREGPWGTYARMDILRSPKHLTGPDLGFPALTFRAWYEAQHGAEGWERLYKIATADWLAYLLWVRDTAGIAVENGTEAVDDRSGAGFRPRRAERRRWSRDRVRAQGRAGRRARRLGRALRAAVPVAGRRTHGGRPPRVPFLGRYRLRALQGRQDRRSGASASAFDNAAVALEAGAAEVRLFSRRPHLPQINKSKWASFPGFFHGFRDLDDDLRWQIFSYIFAEQTPPPHESVLRCDRHAGFAIHFAEAWVDVVPAAGGVTVVTAKARYAFDAVIMATGFVVDLSLRPELARIHDRVLLWGDRVSAEEAARHPQAARFPYLGRGFELIERNPGAAPGLGNIHCFNWGVTFSHGAVAGDIPGVAEGPIACRTRWRAACSSPARPACCPPFTPSMTGSSSRPAISGRAEGACDRRPGGVRQSSSARRRAISVARGTSEETRMCSSCVCAPPPRTPRPSSVATPKAPVKLPSDPPPCWACGSSKPISPARRLARS